MSQPTRTGSTSWRIPTVPEIFDAGLCLVMGHDWNQSGVCDHCGAKR